MKKIFSPKFETVFRLLPNGLEISQAWPVENADLQQPVLPSSNAKKNYSEEH